MILSATVTADKYVRMIKKTERLSKTEIDSLYTILNSIHSY